MSERDSVHTEIEKLQEKVEAREARIAQLERKTKEQEGEVRESTLVISIAFASDGLSNRFRYRPQRQRMQFQVEVLRRGREKAEAEVDSLR